MATSRQITRLTLAATALLGGMLVPAGQPAWAGQCTQVELFADDMESGTGSWTTSFQPSPTAVFCESEWHQDGASSASGTTSWSNSPYSHAFGQNGDEFCWNYLTAPPVLVPAATQSLTMAWQHRYDIEPDTPGCFDFGAVQVSQNGVDWAELFPTYCGLSEPGGGLQFNLESIPLPSFISDANYYVRFAFYSDWAVGSPVHAGWWIDDVQITACVLDPVPAESKSWGAMKAVFRNEE